MKNRANGPASPLRSADAEKVLILAELTKARLASCQAEFIGELPREITVEVLERVSAVLFDPS